MNEKPLSEKKINSDYNSKRRLMRMNENKKVSGVLSGISYYFQVETLHVQVVFLLIVLITGVLPGVIAYIIAAYSLPQYKRDPVDYKVFCEPNSPDAHIKKKKTQL